jgi:hypothetical protein
LEKEQVMTKFVFVAVLAVLAAVLYTIPAQSAPLGADAEMAKTQ